MLVEQERDLLCRASYHNQARVHNGYHYPRSFTTAFRSRANLPKFMRDWPQAVKTDFTALYAIARRNSKVTAYQFERFCDQIGAKIQPAAQSFQEVFNPRLIERVFEVEEYAFDAQKLRIWAHQALGNACVEVRLHTTATELNPSDGKAINVTLKPYDAPPYKIKANYVINCTYSGLNQLKGEATHTHTQLKQEIAEMLLMKMPPRLEGLAITLMDGPFFSIYPFPSQELHSVSHVRYTPHCHWTDSIDINPYQKLKSYQGDSRLDRMVRDIARYVPAITEANYVESLLEVKTVLVKNENDDGRPILFEKSPDLKQYYRILGGKIDNIYDVLEKLDKENFD